MLAPDLVCRRSANYLAAAAAAEAQCGRLPATSPF